MDNRLWQRVKQQGFVERVRLWWFVGVLASVVLLQTVVILALRHHVRVVVVPATLHAPVWLDQRQVSPDYLVEMARFLSVLYLNTSPATQQSRIAQVLQYAAPQYHGQIKVVLQKEAIAQEQHDVTTQFIPTIVAVIPESLQVVVKGEYRIFVGKQEVSFKERRYRLGFRYVAGQLQLIQFRELVDEHEEEVV